MLRLLVILGLFAGAAPAQERRMLDAGEAAAFRGVGRLNIAGARFCTATLISPVVVVTAAHCLYHPRSRARVPLTEIRFVAGLRLGEVAALGWPVRAVTHPDFTFGDGPDFSGVRADLALIELDRPVRPIDATPLATGRRGDGPLAIVSYARDRAQAPSIEEPCPVVSVFGGVAALDCAVTFGVSGAPVLERARRGAGRSFRVVGVVSAMGRVLDGGGDVTLAVLLAPELDALLAALAETPLEPAPEPPGRP